MTEKLYYSDPYKRDFDAVITGVQPSDGQLHVTLDATCFYPEGGGQPADRGTLNGRRVLDVRKDGDEVIHVLEAESTLAEGGTAHGQIDWDRRYDFMQQHSGQHLISATFYRIGGIGTVSVHLGDEISTVELDAESVDEELLEQVETAVNQVVCMNVPIQASWFDEEKLDTGSLRRELKVSGAIRVVSIEDTDRVACGGVHVANTGEIGLIKLVGTEVIRKHLRTVWKIGERAYDDYRLKSEVSARLVDLFSSPLAELESAARKTLERLEAAEKAVREAEEKRARDTAASIAETDDTVITHTFDNEDNKFLKSVATTLISQGRKNFCLLNIQPGRLQWLAGVPEEAQDTNLKPGLDEILPIIDGKGGGKPPLWQGVGTRIEAAHEFLDAFRGKVAS